MDMKCTAMIGAIALNKGCFYYETYDFSIDTTKYIKFIRNLHKKCNGEPYVLYMDNLKIHSTKKAKEVYEELGIRVLYSPVYSPNLNAIEHFHSPLKHYVKKQRLQDMVKGKKRNFRLHINEAIKKID